MALLDSFLALALTLAVLATVATLLLEIATRTLGVKRRGQVKLFKKLLENDTVIGLLPKAAGDEAKAAANEAKTAKEIGPHRWEVIKDILNNPFSRRPMADSEKGQWFVSVSASGIYSEVSLEHVLRRLLDAGKVKKDKELLKHELLTVARKYEELSSALGAEFKRNAQWWSVVVGIVLAFVMNVDGVRLLQAYMQDQTLRQTAIEKIAIPESPESVSLGKLTSGPAATQALDEAAAAAKKASDDAATAKRASDEAAAAAKKASDDAATAKSASDDAAAAAKLAPDDAAVAQKARDAADAAKKASDAATAANKTRDDAAAAAKKASDADIAAKEASDAAAAAAKIEELKAQLAIIDGLALPIGAVYFPYCYLPWGSENRKISVDPLCKPAEAGSPPNETENTAEGEKSLWPAGVLWFLKVLVTGMLIGLGAPFWYDVARRLAAVRTAFGGKAPREQRDSGEDAPAKSTERKDLIERIVTDFIGLPQPDTGAGAPATPQPPPPQS